MAKLNITKSNIILYPWVRAVISGRITASISESEAAGVSIFMAHLAHYQV